MKKVVYCGTCVWWTGKLDLYVIWSMALGNFLLCLIHPWTLSAVWCGVGVGWMGLAGAFSCHLRY